ncbi:uncharacterized protein [Amphiura filiformis]|uniref:uncharacterized protein n=1 Tax=Amphiura filiformis TaxID=82378 RepID=UPI003B21B229
MTDNNQGTSRKAQGEESTDSESVHEEELQGISSGHDKTIKATNKTRKLKSKTGKRKSKNGKRKFKTNYSVSDSSEDESNKQARKKLKSKHVVWSSDDDFVDKPNAIKRNSPRKTIVEDNQEKQEHVPHWKKRLAIRRRKRAEIAKSRKTLTKREKKKQLKEKMYKNKREKHLAKQQELKKQKELDRLFQEELRRHKRDLDRSINLERSTHKRHPNFNSTETEFRLSFSNLDNINSFSGIQEQIELLFERAIERALDQLNVSQDDSIRIILTNPSLDRTISMSFAQMSQFDIAQHLLTKLEKIIQSNENFHFLADMRLIIVVSHKPKQKGGHFARRTTLSIKKYLQKKKAIVVIKNRNDDMCFARALAVTIAMSEKKENQIDRKTYNKIVNGRPEQYWRAFALHDKASVEMGVLCGKNEWSKFQEVLEREHPKKYGINVWVMGDYPKNKQIYVGSPTSEKQLHVLHVDNHYHAINSITGFLCKNYYCPHCNKGYQEKGKHQCLNTCQRCRKDNCDGDLRCTNCNRYFNSEQSLAFHLRNVKCQTVIQEQNLKYCNMCNRHFKSIKCLSNHLMKSKKKKVSVCDLYKKCKDCGVTYNKKKYQNEDDRDDNDSRLTKHQCDEVSCFICNGIYPPDHVCYIRKIASDTEQKGKKKPKHIENKEDENTKDDDELDLDDCPDSDDDEMEYDAISTKVDKKGQNYKYIFFDFESMFQNDEHVPNLCVCQWRCEVCLRNEKDQTPRDESYVILNPNEEAESEVDVKYPVDSCRCGKERQKIFQGPNTKAEFAKFLLSDYNQDTIVISHNGKAYDNIFALNEFLKCKGVLPDVIFTGGKIMCLKIQAINLKMIDSHNFCTMPLSQFPKTFQLTELKKGYFPYFWNTPEHQDYIGELPPIEAYGASSMKPDARKSFLEWYKKQKDAGIQFHLQEELREYCVSDVTILTQGCLKFRDIFMEASINENVVGDCGVDVFKTCITIASACSYIYRRNFMPEKSIAILPPDGFVGNTLQSKKALQWLYYQEQTRNIQIQHYGRGKEVKILGKYRVDGIHGKTVFSFMGDYWHGNLRKYKSKTLNKKVGRTMGELNLDTMDRKREIEQAGYKVIAIWEDEFDEMLKDERVQHILRDFNYQEPLKPRDAYFGGRTGATKLYYKAKEDELLRYYDVTSLYPFTMYDMDFPVGKHEIITDPADQNISSYFGLAKVTVLPPQNLYHPVLPFRCNNKLLFTLCRTCGEINTSPKVEKDESYIIRKCSHDVEKRQWTGTYTTIELEEAVREGYLIQRIHQVWHFKNKSRDLFKRYISTFLRYKQESGGYPKDCVTDKEREDYVSDYLQHQGIALRPDKIKVNPGLRATSKMCLNSLYGKFGQRNNLPSKRYVENIGQLWYHLDSPEYEVHDVRFISDDCAQLHFTKANEFVLPSKHTNVVIAAWTTSLARLQLYKYLKALQRRVCYYDTDSVIFVSKKNPPPGEYEPLLGNYLGDLTNEISGDDEMEEFISAGSKNYTYRLKSGETVSKVRGFTLNFHASQQINFDSIKAMVLGEGQQEIVVHNEHQIVRNMSTITIHNKPMSKKYRKVFNKRILEKGFDSYPHGYIFE